MSVEDGKKCAEQKSEWTKILALSGFATTLGTSVPGGYCIGVMNSPAAHMKFWCNETLIKRYDIYLSESAMDILWSTIVSIFLIGGAIGSLTGALASNKFGRKGSTSLCGLLFLISAICFFCCRLVDSVELLLIGRLIAGLSAGLTTACLPTYLSEIAPLSLRGTFGVFCPMGFTAGVIISQIFSLNSLFGSAEQWHIALSFYIILIILCFAPVKYFPESPKWLYIVKGNRDEARQELKSLRGNIGMEIISKDIENMDMEANSKDQSNGFCDVLKDPKLFLPLFIVCAYQGGQQLSGINAIFYYSVSIFKKAGLSTQAAELANLGAGSVNLMASLLGPTLMSRINRRPLMMLSTALSSCFLFAFAIMFYYIDSIKWFAYGCIGCIFLYIFFFQFGLGPIPFFIGTEIFEVAPRPVAMSLGSLASWGCNFLVGMTFPTLQNVLGPFVFIPCSTTCLLLFFLTKYYLPETKGRDPTEVAPIIANGFKSKVN